MSNLPIRLSLNGIEYTWDGESWYETKSFATPPTVIISQLIKQLAQQQRWEANYLLQQAG